MKLNYGIDKNTIIVASEPVTSGSKTFNTGRNFDKTEGLVK